MINFKKKKFLMTFFCAVGLSTTFLGFSSLAMEQDQEGINHVNNSQHETLIEKLKPKKFGYKYLVINKVLNKDQERLVSDIFQKELLSGRDENYAYYYAVLIINQTDENIARKKAEVYQKELATGQSKICADYYAVSLIDQALPEELARLKLNVFRIEIDFKGYIYADLKASAVLRREERYRMICKIDDGSYIPNSVSQDNSLKRDIHSKYDCNFTTGNNYFDDEYEIKNMKKLYDREMENGRSNIYAHTFSLEVIVNRRTEEEARVLAEKCEKLFKGKLEWTSKKQ